MFTPKQNVQWEAERYKFIRQWMKKPVPSEMLCAVQMSNYAKLLVAAFNVLFNERLKRSGRAI